MNGITGLFWDYSRSCNYWTAELLLLNIKRMVNKILSNEKQLLEWRKVFNGAKPFRFLIIDDFLEPSLAHHLAEDFPSLEEMNISYNGINEQKSEHSDFGKL